MCFLKEWSLCINLRVAFTAFYFLCVEEGRRSEKEGREERVQEDLANKVVTKGLFFSFHFSPNYFSDFDMNCFISSLPVFV